MLAVPGAITIVLLLVTKHKFPNPEQFEPEPKEYVPFRMKKEFVLYIAGISLFAFGFIDYSIILMHVSRLYTPLASGLAETSALVNSGTLPLLYAGAMLVDAAAALVFGHMYDKKGVRALVWSTLLSAPFALFVFAFDSIPALLLGYRPLGSGDGGPGVHSEGRREQHGAQEQSGHGLWYFRVLLRRVLVPGELAPGRAVRCEHSGDGSCLHGRAVDRDPPLSLLGQGEGDPLSIAKAGRLLLTSGSHQRKEDTMK